MMMMMMTTTTTTMMINAMPIYLYVRLRKLGFASPAKFTPLL
jgi:hypothetical protein